MHHLAALPLAAALAFPGTPDAQIQIAEASARIAGAVPGYASVAVLADSPARWLGEPTHVIVQVEGEPEGTWNPFLGRFHPADYRRIRVWGDEQWLWQKDEFEAPAADLFVRRGTVLEGLLSRARRHDRLALEVVVRELHAGAAWIEIIDAAYTPEQTPEGTVLHAIRGLDLIEREGWSLAVSELERALAPNLPGHVRRELETLRDQAQSVLDAMKRPERTIRVGR